MNRQDTLSQGEQDTPEPGDDVSLQGAPIPEIADFIEARGNFLISSHRRPDGDSLGSQLALAEGLRHLGKKATIVNIDLRPQNYAKLPGVGTILLKEEVNGDFDGLIVLECANYSRTGVKGLEAYQSVNIDHHPQNDFFGQINWVDPSAAAVAEMVYDLFRFMEVEISPDMATNLYAGILTDTGSFQFSNTHNQTFRIAADLVDRGADPAEIARDVMMNRPLSRLLLLGEVLKTLEFTPDGKIGWILLNQEMLVKTGAAHNDTEGMVNYPLSVEGVRVCAFFREEGPELFRVSLRSKEEDDVGAVAKALGGGGHRNAAGVSMKGSYPEVKKRLLGHLERLVA